MTIGFQRLLIICACSLWGIGVTAGGPEGTFTFTYRVLDDSDQVLIEGRFSGTDNNGDGWLEAGELTAYAENVPLRFSGSCLSGRKGQAWRTEFDDEAYPVIHHDLGSLKTFRFGLTALEKGEVTLEYETNTRDMVPSRGYHFWRQSVLSDGGRAAEITSGVSDGSEGIEFCLVEAASLRVEAKRN